MSLSAPRSRDRYFSAHWCPPCRGFTPQLAKWYHGPLGQKLEVVFVSADRDQASFNGYFGEMPWLALPFKNRNDNGLSEKYGVSGIPALVILGPDGKLITRDGRTKVSQDPTGSFLPAPVRSGGGGGGGGGASAKAKAKAAPAAAKAKAKAKASASGGGGGAGASTLRSGSRTIAGFPCKVVVNGGSSSPPKLAVIILHGYGATNDDFVQLAPLFGDGVALVLPQAPTGRGGVTEWWEIDVMKWVGAMQGGEDDRAKLIRTEFAGLAACRAKLVRLVAETRALCGGLPLERVVVGGFSQGAMTAMDLGLAVPAGEGRVGGVIMLSGGPIVIDQWHAALQQPHMKGLRVLQTHGLNDQTLPYPVSQWASQFLAASAANHKFVSHTGGHELGGMAVIQAIREFVGEVKK